jgi:Raf kinase inhibitor-like YbhB/YbcL family protein
MRATLRHLAVVPLLAVLAGCATSTSPSAPAGSSSPAAVSSTGSAAQASPAASPPSPAPSTPPSAAASASTGAAQSPTPEATMPDFALTSTSFDAGGSIPKRFTCDGEDASPELAWTGAPDGTVALTLLVDDPDARNFVHWIVLDMAGASSGALPRGVGVSPDAPKQGRNDFGKVGWGGPCPPSGTHRYAFKLYATAAPLDLPGTPGGGDVRKALDKAKVLGKATLEATYRRGG